MRTALVAALLVAVAQANVIAHFSAPYHNLFEKTIGSLEAAFGPDVPGNNQLFDLVPLTGDEEYGCGNITTEPTSYLSAALIKRGSNCDFDIKVWNAQMAGFKAVIIYNDVDNELVRMGSDSSIPIRIPSVFIGRSDGEFLMMAPTAPNGTLVTLNPDAVPTWPSFLVTFVVVIAVVIFMFTVFTFYRQRMRLREIVVAHMTPAEIIRLPSRAYDEKTDRGDTCCICLEEYASGSQLTVLPCNHKFHPKCIDPWLARRRTCPMCKRDPVASERTPLLPGEIV